MQIWRVVQLLHQSRRHWPPNDWALPHGKMDDRRQRLRKSVGQKMPHLIFSLLRSPLPLPLFYFCEMFKLRLPFCVTAINILYYFYKYSDITISQNVRPRQTFFLSSTILTIKSLCCRNQIYGCVLPANIKLNCKGVNGWNAWVYFFFENKEIKVLYRRNLVLLSQHPPSRSFLFSPQMTRISNFFRLSLFFFNGWYFSLIFASDLQIQTFLLEFLHPRRKKKGWLAFT